MTRSQFERELTRATGETRDTLRHRGFQLLEPPDLEPLVIDWDELQQADRISTTPIRSQPLQQAA